MTKKIIYVELSQLALSSQNARRTGTGDVADLAANIAANGLFQNLLVTPGKRGYEVIAGGRRLSALQLLEREGRLPAEILTDGVPCQAITDEAAINEASTAENTIRVPLHPADQFEAFRKMIEQDRRSIGDVAAHFGISEITVERRLRLANVAPDLFELYRGDQMSLEQITALAISEDHEAQRNAWHQARSSYDRAAPQLRAALTEKQISSRDYRVRFVGLGEYEAAGGASKRDLFSDTGGGYVLDEPLLDRLVAEKLTAAIDALKAEGWSFVQLSDPDKQYQFRHACEESLPKRLARELDETEAARLSSLRARLEVLNDQIEAEDEFVDDDDERSIEAEAIDAEIRQLTAPVEIYSDRQKAKAGCQVVLSRDSGTLSIYRGLIPTDPKATNAVADSKGEKAPVKAPELSEAMIRRLTAHRTIALQSALIANADVALAAVAHALLAGILHHGTRNGGDFALNISATQEFDQLDRFAFQDVTDSPHYRASREALSQLLATLKVPAAEKALLPWLLQQNRNVVVSLLAAVAAWTIDSNQGALAPHAADALVAALDIDLADYWQPTAATFFSHVPRAMGMQAVEEAFGTHHGATAQLYSGQKFSKDEFAGVAESVMQRSGWLPKPLRRPGYKPRTKSTAPEPAEATPASKAAAKKKPAMKKVATRKPAAKAKPPAKPAKKGATKKKPAKKTPSPKKKATRK